MLATLAALIHTGSHQLFSQVLFFFLCDVTKGTDGRVLGIFEAASLELGRKNKYLKMSILWGL